MQMAPRCVNTRGRDTTDRRSVVPLHDTASPSPQSIPDDNDELFESPDFADVVKSADESFAAHKRAAMLVLHIACETFGREGPMHGFTLLDALTDYGWCPSEVVPAAYYLASRRLIQVNRDDPEDGGCPCHACEAQRMYITLPYHFGADRDRITEQRRNEAIRAQAEASRIVNSRQPARQGYVYLLKCGPRYKIGITKDIQRRINELTKQQPFPLELVHCAVGAEYAAKERELHEQYDAVREHGEWFDLTPDQVAEIIESMNDWASESREG